ncbi:MAG: hypothetical protein J0M08_05860 [Bacteroidetes bacterium]|nr:hypothetical protein [Bacteroidota bacterium]
MNLRKLHIGLFVTLMVLGNLSHAHENLSDIDLKKVHHKKVRRFLRKQQLNNIIRFNDIQPSLVDNAADIDQYSTHTKTYVVNQSISKSWEAYKNANPAIAWCGKNIGFDVLLKKSTGEIVYNDSKEYDGAKKGNVLFLNLKVCKGLANVPVAFEITTVDPANRIMEFSYIKGNKSQGKQQLKFVEGENGQTQIIHQTYFKSGSKFRDKYIYPFFHTRIINQFHKNIKKVAASI